MKVNSKPRISDYRFLLRFGYIGFLWVLGFICLLGVFIGVERGFDFPAFFPFGLLSISAKPFSLVIFSIFGIALNKRFSFPRSILILAFAYSTWELIPQFTKAVLQTYSLVPLDVGSPNELSFSVWLGVMFLTTLFIEFRYKEFLINFTNVATILMFVQYAEHPLFYLGGNGMFDEIGSEITWAGFVFFSFRQVRTMQ